jgi:hypothetical protein
MAIFIFCAGMRRSASTLQYNIVKRILEFSGKGKALGYAESPEIEKIIEEHMDQEGYFVIKVHDYFPLAGKLNNEGKAKIVFSYRDVRDIIVSSMHKWGEGNFNRIYRDEFMNLLKNSYTEWMNLNDLHVSSYEEIQKSLIGEVNKLAKFLNLPIQQDENSRIAYELSFNQQKKEILNGNFVNTPAGKMEENTLLHTDHLRSGKTDQWKQELTSYQIARIQMDWKTWMKENGYKRHSTILNHYVIFHFYSLLRRIYSAVRSIK